ncbi:hypothetical protein CAPTEDRAFT_109221, partial [Capitella teleta]
MIETLPAENGDSKKVVCYFTNWSQYRSGEWSFKAKDINAHLCTHIIIAFARLDWQNLDIQPLEWNDEATYAVFRELKVENPELKVLVAVGGWNVGSWTFSQLTATETSRRIFAENVVQFLNKEGLDGLDVDWEYPVDAQQQFSELLEALHLEFHKDPSNALLLSAALSAGVGTISSSYDIPTIAKYLDFANIMAYDLRGAWEIPRRTAMHSALYPGDASDTSTVDSAIRYYMDRGMPSHKLILGIPLYGRGWTLTDPQSTSVGSSADAPSIAGAFSREEGILFYFEICTAVESDAWIEGFDDDQKSPFAYSSESKQWVGYDDQKSAEIKAEYIVDLELGGAMFWELGSADFRNACGDGVFPVITAMKDALN